MLSYSIKLSQTDLLDQRRRAPGDAAMHQWARWTAGASSHLLDAVERVGAYSADATQGLGQSGYSSSGSHFTSSPGLPGAVVHKLSWSSSS